MEHWHVNRLLCYREISVNLSKKIKWRHANHFLKTWIEVYETKSKIVFSHSLLSHSQNFFVSIFPEVFYAYISIYTFLFTQMGPFCAYCSTICFFPLRVWKWLSTFFLMAAKYSIMWTCHNWNNQPYLWPFYKQCCQEHSCSYNLVYFVNVCVN